MLCLYMLLEECNFTCTLCTFLWSTIPAAIHFNYNLMRKSKATVHGSQRWRLGTLNTRREKWQSETSKWPFVTHTLLSKVDCTIKCNDKCAGYLIFFFADQRDVRGYKGWTDLDKRNHQRSTLWSQTRRINKAAAKAKHIQQSKGKSCYMSSNLFCYYWVRKLITYTM